MTLRTLEGCQLFSACTQALGNHDLRGPRPGREETSCKKALALAPLHRGANRGPMQHSPQSCQTHTHTHTHTDQWQSPH